MTRFFLFLISIVSLEGNAVANDLKVWLSSNPVINSQMYLIPDSSSSTPGTVVGQYLSGAFKLNYKGSLSKGVIFFPDSHLNWATVIQTGPDAVTIDRMQEQYFGYFHDPIKLDAVFKGTANALRIQKSDSFAFPFISVSATDISFALVEDDSKLELGKFAFINGARISTVNLKEALHPYFPEPLRGIWLVPYDQSANWEFLLEDDALITKFSLPSRQGCSLNLTGRAKISMTDSEVRFYQTANTGTVG